MASQATEYGFKRSSHFLNFLKFMPEVTLEIYHEHSGAGKDGEATRANLHRNSVVCMRSQFALGLRVKASPDFLILRSRFPKI